MPDSATFNLTASIVVWIAAFLVKKTSLDEHLVVGQPFLVPAEWNKSCAESQADFATMNPVRCRGRRPDLGGADDHLDVQERSSPLHPGRRDRTCAPAAWGSWRNSSGPAQADMAERGSEVL